MEKLTATPSRQPRKSEDADRPQSSDSPPKYTSPSKSLIRKKSVFTLAAEFFKPNKVEKAEVPVLENNKQERRKTPWSSFVSLRGSKDSKTQAPDFETVRCHSSSPKKSLESAVEEFSMHKVTRRKSLQDLLGTVGVRFSLARRPINSEDPTLRIEPPLDAMTEFQEISTLVLPEPAIPLPGTTNTASSALNMNFKSQISSDAIDSPSKVRIGRKSEEATSGEPNLQAELSPRHLSTVAQFARALELSDSASLCDKSEQLKFTPSPQSLETLTPAVSASANQQSALSPQVPAHIRFIDKKDTPQYRYSDNFKDEIAPQNADLDPCFSGGALGREVRHNSVHDEPETKQTELLIKNVETHIGLVAAKMSKNLHISSSQKRWSVDSSETQTDDMSDYYSVENEREVQHCIDRGKELMTLGTPPKYIHSNDIGKSDISASSTNPITQETAKIEVPQELVLSESPCSISNGILSLSLDHPDARISGVNNLTHSEAFAVPDPANDLRQSLNTKISEGTTSTVGQRQASSSNSRDSGFCEDAQPDWDGSDDQYESGGDSATARLYLGSLASSTESLPPTVNTGLCNSGHDTSMLSPPNETLPEESRRVKTWGELECDYLDKFAPCAENFPGERRMVALHESHKKLNGIRDFSDDEDEVDSNGFDSDYPDTLDPEQEEWTTNEDAYMLPHVEHVEDIAEASRANEGQATTPNESETLERSNQSASVGCGITTNIKKKGKQSTKGPHEADEPPTILEKFGDQLSDKATWRFIQVTDFPKSFWWFFPRDDALTDPELIAEDWKRWGIPRDEAGILIESFWVKWMLWRKQTNQISVEEARFWVPSSIPSDETSVAEETGAPSRAPSSITSDEICVCQEAKALPWAPSSIPSRSVSDAYSETASTDMTKLSGHLFAHYGDQLRECHAEANDDSAFCQKDCDDRSVPSSMSDRTTDDGYGFSLVRETSMLPQAELPETDSGAGNDTDQMSLWSNAESAGLAKGMTSQAPLQPTRLAPPVPEHLAYFNVGPFTNATAVGHPSPSGARLAMQNRVLTPNMNLPKLPSDVSSQKNPTIQVTSPPPRDAGTKEIENISRNLKQYKFTDEEGK